MVPAKPYVQYDVWGNEIKQKPKVVTPPPPPPVEPISKMRPIQVNFGQNVEGVAQVDRELLKMKADEGDAEIDNLLAGMLSSFDDNENQLDTLME